MKNITLAIDEKVLDRVRVIAAERKTTVNALVRDFLNQQVARDDMAASRDKGSPSIPLRMREDRVTQSETDPEETTHQRMQRLLDEGRAKYADRDWFDREETDDRDYQRAQGYFENRARLLKLIDESTADMGTQKWNRGSLYES
jgi:hypothetical protein